MKIQLKVLFPNVIGDSIFTGRFKTLFSQICSSFQFSTLELINRDGVIDLTAPTDDKEETIERPPDSIASFYATSVDPSYETNHMKPIPGALVVSSLGEIRHPARRDDNFGWHHIIVGSVIGFKKIHKNFVEEWEKGRSFEHYVNREHVVVEWVPIQSANVRYKQVSVKNRIRKFEYDIIENHFCALPSVSPKTCGY